MLRGNDFSFSFIEMHQLCLGSFFILCIIAKEQGYLEPYIARVAAENTYLETAFNPVSSPVWGHHQSPFDLPVAAALNSLANITGDEKDEQKILLAFGLAIEKNHTEALEKLCQVYEGQDLSSDIIMNAFIRAARNLWPFRNPLGPNINPWGKSYKVIKILSKKKVFNTRKAEKLLLLAIKEYDSTGNVQDEMVGRILVRFIDSVDALRESLFMAARSRSVIGQEIVLAHRGKFTQTDIEIASKLAYNKYKLGDSNFLSYILKNGGANEYRGELPEVKVVEGQFPTDADSSEYKFIASLNGAGFGRLVVKLTENDPSFLHDILIKSAGDASVTLHGALLQISECLNGEDVNLVPFMVACIKGFDDVVASYITDGKIKEYTNLPYFTELTLSKAIANKHVGVVAKLIDGFRYNASALSSPLIRAVSCGNLEFVKCLLQAGADPVGTGNEPFIEACDKLHADIIWYLFGIPAVKEKAVKENTKTAKALVYYLFRKADVAGMRRLFLGDPPEISFDLKFLCIYDTEMYDKGIRSFFNDRDLVALLSRHKDIRLLKNVFKISVYYGSLSIVKGFLENIDSFDKEFTKFTLKSFLLTIAIRGKRPYEHMVMLLLNHPRRSRRDRYRLQIRLLQRYSSEAYVTEDFLKAIRSSDILRDNIKYYLPEKTLHQIYPDESDWKSDPFLMKVTRSCLNEYSFSWRHLDNLEKFYMLTFFDKSAGLFGGTKINSGTIWMDNHFIGMVESAEVAKLVTGSPQLNLLKRHLEQAAEIAKYIENSDLAYELIGRRLRDLPVGDTYLFSIRGDQHTGYALATKADASHLNVKVFNADLNIITDYDDAGTTVPYIEWDGVSLDELLSKSLHTLDSSEFILSEKNKPHPPANLPGHMRIKGQRIGSCAAYKFWLIARHDLETLPRFLELAVAIHLHFIEDLTANFDAKMTEWEALLPRGWLAIIRTPHFEGQLLRDIKDIKDEDRGMYEKLYSKIIHSVQRRYRTIYPERCDWENEQAVLDFIHWRERYLATVSDDVPV